MARERTVDVEDPELSDRANRALTDEVREVERTARPSDDAARSSSEQQTAMTPSSTPTDSAP
jgi:hypothetical protein